MRRHVPSIDGVDIAYEVSGQGSQSLFFVHGWLGNARWWDLQQRAFASAYRIVQIDLAGHGQSGKNRRDWSIESYAHDIQAVFQDLKLDACHLIGHSISGSNVIEAGWMLGKSVRSVILIDTLLDLDNMPTLETSAPMFEGLRTNYRGFMETALTQFLLLPGSPQDVRQRLRQEMLNMDPGLAIATLEPFYRADIRPTASRLQVPVRAINSIVRPTNAVANRKYCHDFDFKLISDVGHYPMMEAPERFNQLLDETLKDLTRTPP